MITDITFGQFINTNSFLHKLDPRTKLLLLILFIVFIFLANSFVSLLFLVVSLLVFIVSSKIPLKLYLKNIKTILPVIILTAVLNAVYVNEGKVLLDWWVFVISTGGISRAVFMSLRIIVLILASAVLTYTTSPTSLTSAIESLLSPLKYIKLGNAVHMMAMIMTIALRFIPTLVEETQKIMNAQKARGADLESGSFIKRIKALMPILIPLLFSSIRRAYELAEAMECRCYNGGEGRTSFRVMRFRVCDVIAFIIVVVVCVVTLCLNYLTPFIYSLL